MRTLRRRLQTSLSLRHFDGRRWLGLGFVLRSSFLMRAAVEFLGQLGVVEDVAVALGGGG
jgi:hypothetical protein